MSALIAPSARSRSPGGTQEPKWVRVCLIAVALAFIALFLVLPLAAVLTEALRNGVHAYREALAPAYPRRPDGTTLLPFRRLFMVATAL